MRRLVSPLPVLLLLLGCGSGGVSDVDPFAEREIPAELAADLPSIVDGNARFACDLYGELRGESDGNLFLSPFSISTALAMTFAGAAGGTADEMAAALRFPAERESFHACYGALVTSLDRGAALGGYRLSIANRLWGQSGYPFLDSFLATCDDDYGAGFEELDFTAEPDGCRETINDWVAEKTEQKIRDLLPPGSIDVLTRLVLTNAIYFKGDWALPFDVDDTSDREFTRADGSKVTAPLMDRTDTFGFFRGDHFSLLVMDYVGHDLAMVGLLPDEPSGIAALEASLTADNLASWIAGAADEKVHVRFPRFEFTTFFSVKDFLVDLGMASAFQPPGDTAGADFSAMTGAPELFINDVIHKAYVRVNEEGTEAAAATGVTVGATSAPEIALFLADHPFLFLIHDRVTGSILFLGRVMDPTATP